MLVIPYDLKEGPFGIGIYARTPLKKGACVYAYTPLFMQILTPEHLASLSPSSLDRIRSYSYRGRGEARLAAGYAYFCTDDSRFMNHHTHPTLVAGETPETQDNYYTARAIAAGEELTCDYYTFSEPGDWSVAFLETPRI